MEPEFWRERWREGRIGFHRSDVHPLLQRYAERFAKGARILVPLAGKTLDMHHLVERGHAVVGVELVESAARDFFAEAGLSAVEDRTRGGHLRLAGGGVELIVADFFDTRPHELGRIDAVYDRAALIALPPDLRARYAAHLATLLEKDAGALTITVEYDPKEMSGPPFSVTRAEIEAIFGGPFEIFPVAKEDVLERNPSLRQRGLSHLVEHAMWLRRRL